MKDKGDYDGFFAAGFDFDEITSPELAVNKYFKSITSLLASDHFKLVLEIGCGTGLHLGHWINLGMRGVGLDLSEHAIELAKNRLGNNPDLIALIVGDILDHVKMEPLKARFPLIVSHKHFPNIFAFDQLELLFSGILLLLPLNGIFVFDYVFHIPRVQEQLSKYSDDKFNLISESEKGIEIEILYSIEGFDLSESYSIATQEHLVSLLNDLGFKVLGVFPWIEDNELDQSFVLESLRTIVVIQNMNC